LTKKLRPQSRVVGGKKSFDCGYRLKKKKFAKSGSWGENLLGKKSLRKVRVGMGEKRKKIPPEQRKVEM